MTGVTVTGRDPCAVTRSRIPRWVGKGGGAAAVSAVTNAQCRFHFLQHHMGCPAVVAPDSFFCSPHGGRVGLSAHGDNAGNLGRGNKPPAGVHACLDDGLLAAVTGGGGDETAVTVFAAVYFGSTAVLHQGCRFGRSTVKRASLRAERPTLAMKGRTRRRRGDTLCILIPATFECYSTDKLDPEPLAQPIS